MTKIRRRLSERVAGFVRDWSLPRQLAGQSVMSEAARSTTSEDLRPRLEEADRIGTSVCPFCAVGCGQLIYAKNGRPIHIEGDPRSPINQGTLCPKGAGTLGMLLSPRAHQRRALPRAATPTAGRRGRWTGRWSGSPS